MKLRSWGLSPAVGHGLALLVAGSVALPAATAERPGSILGGLGTAAPAAIITGTVRDPAGKPAAGLTLIVVPEYLVNNAKIKTDANGRFEITPNLQLSGPANRKLAVVASDAARNLAAAEVVELASTTIDLHLEPALTIAGSLTDSDGRALTRGTATVSLWVGNSTSTVRSEGAVTDAQGRFALPALPVHFRYWVWATAAGYGSAGRILEATDTATNRVVLEPFALKPANLPLGGQVLDANQKPATNAWVNLSGDGQPSEVARTDNQGRFRFKGVCAGPVRLFANAAGSFANTTAVGGDTNVVIVLGSGFTSLRPRPARDALQSHPVPDLASVGLDATTVPAGKPLLICLFDLSQRPSRRFLRSLTEELDVARRHGLVVVGIQAAPDSTGALREWQSANPLPFPVGVVSRETPATKWAAEFASLPWLILTDKTRKVVAEGFELDALETKLQETK